MKSRRKSPVNTITTEPQHCSISLRLKILSRLPFFEGVSSKALEQVNQHFVEVGYEAGDIVYSADDPAEHLYVVAEGKVKLLQHAEGGRDVLLDILTTGEFFGNLSTLGTTRYIDTAQLQTPACLLSIRSDAFQQILDAHPKLALKTIAIMAERLNTANLRVLQIVSMPVERRIAFTLLALGKKLGRKQETGLLIDVPLSREDLAEMTGTTPETASRVMSQMQNNAIIESGRQWIAIINRDALQELAEEKIIPAVK